MLKMCIEIASLKDRLLSLFGEINVKDKLINPFIFFYYTYDIA